MTSETAATSVSILPAGAPDAVESIPFTAAPEPTGVAGLDAADPLCSAWAAYSGTLQALGVAASFGDLQSSEFAALELVAAPRLAELAVEIDAAWPGELAGEHDVVVDRRLGPYVRRAQRGVDALRAAGVTDAELATLSSTWQTALMSRDPAVPVIDLPAIAEPLQAKLDAAARAYDTAVTPFAQDPSLVVDVVDTPATDAYLVAHCPDLASSGVGDAL
ncbi:MAG: hypothetical protein M3P52_09705 [Actinomycetota bacterium]|nr:hypothetical protein [Actinomycetota bacterium]